MTTSHVDVDYTRHAGRRGVTVILCDVFSHQCKTCPAYFVDIHRVADLERELASTRTLRRIKQIRCTFRDEAWVLAFRVLVPERSRRKPR
jgi:hypothetical protein